MGDTSRRQRLRFTLGSDGDRACLALNGSSSSSTISVDSPPSVGEVHDRILFGVEAGVTDISDSEELTKRDFFQ